MLTMKNLLLVMTGGSLGAASRYVVSLIAARWWGVHFPFGTLIVNLSGCFLIGMIFAAAERFRFLTPDIRLLLITGYLGALTTFSSFALESVNAARAGVTATLLINVVVNNAGGLALTFLGIWVGSIRIGG